jgi:hypothetical protein
MSDSVADGDTKVVGGWVVGIKVVHSRTGELEGSVVVEGLEDSGSRVEYEGAGGVKVVEDSM